MSELTALRRSFRRMHRRAQKAEAALRHVPAHHYGRDVLAALAREKQRNRDLQRQLNAALQAPPQVVDWEPGCK